MKAKLKKKTLNTAYGALLIARVTAQRNMVNGIHGLAGKSPSQQELRDLHSKIEYFNDINAAIDEIWPYLEEKP